MTVSVSLTDSASELDIQSLTGADPEGVVWDWGGGGGHSRNIILAYATKGLRGHWTHLLGSGGGGWGHVNYLPFDTTV